LSVAVRLVMDTVREVAVAGTTKAEITGAVISGIVMVTDALLLVDTFPAASLTQAYRVLVPSVVKL